MAYLHCPSCERTAWLDSTTEPALLCLHCGTALTPMPVGFARQLIRAVRERFARDAQLDAGQPRFVRD
jgi:hypothetical protein